MQLAVVAGGASQQLRELGAVLHALLQLGLLCTAPDGTPSALRNISCASRIRSSQACSHHGSAAQHDRGTGPDGEGQAVAQQHTLHERHAQHREHVDQLDCRVGSIAGGQQVDASGCDGCSWRGHGSGQQTCSAAATHMLPPSVLPSANQGFVGTAQPYQHHAL